ncbi:MAG: hypothetical protein J1E78_05335 [Muribaculaceae bacterium]|nr:hypothetical protein [Muribaculaceae bacterium]
MTNILRSKPAAWIAFLVIIFVIVITFRLRPVWWAFIDEFFAFMMIFSQLAAVYIFKFSYYAGKKLQVIAAICGVLMILSLIGEYIAYQVIYG